MSCLLEEVGSIAQTALRSRFSPKLSKQHFPSILSGNNGVTPSHPCFKEPRKNSKTRLEQKLMNLERHKQLLLKKDNLPVNDYI